MEKDNRATIHRVNVKMKDGTEFVQTLTKEEFVDPYMTLKRNDNKVETVKYLGDQK